MIELIITVAIFSIIVLTLASIITTTQKEFTYFEAYNLLKTKIQEITNKTGLYLSESKRIFENNTDDNAYLARVNLSYTVLPDTVLPTIDESGSISPESDNFDSSKVGNSLFFASFEPQAILKDIADGGGSTFTIRINLYRFHYYYPGQIFDKGIADRNFSLGLIHWESVKYADYTEIDSYSGTKKENIVKALRNQSGVYYAWKVSETDVNNAFYNLNSDGSITLDASHQIIEENEENMLEFTTGISGASIRCGLCFNTGGDFNPGVTVPQFATSNNEFPAGFEVVAVGPAGNRKILLRLVLVSQSRGGIRAIEQVSIWQVKDIW